MDKLVQKHSHGMFNYSIPSYVETDWVLNPASPFTQGLVHLYLAVPNRLLRNYVESTSNETIGSALSFGTAGALFGFGSNAGASNSGITIADGNWKNQLTNSGFTAMWFGNQNTTTDGARLFGIDGSWYVNYRSASSSWVFTYFNPGTNQISFSNGATGNQARIVSYSIANASANLLTLFYSVNTPISAASGAVTGPLTSNSNPLQLHGSSMTTDVPSALCSCFAVWNHPMTSAELGEFRALTGFNPWRMFLMPAIADGYRRQKRYRKGSFFMMG